MRLRVLPHFGNERQVSSIAREDVARFRGSEIGRPKRDGARVSTATVNRMMWALAAFGAWSLERKYHLGNPWSGHDNLPEDALPPQRRRVTARRHPRRGRGRPPGPVPVARPVRVRA